MSAMYTYVNTQLAPPAADARSLHNSLEKGSDQDKILAMNEILGMTISGDSQPQLLMDIIRYVLPSKNKRLKKLMHAYWETVPKHDADGKLKQEMILVVNAIRNELQHPNEYIRGSCLRFLTKFREPELLEPLVPTIRQCLEHRYAYVRKNAVLCIFAIAQYEATSFLIPDAAELIYSTLTVETDSTVLHNAFVSLSYLNRNSAYQYFHSSYADFNTFEQSLQLAFVNFSAKDAQEKPELMETYTILLSKWAQLGSISSIVSYQIATALASLASGPSSLLDVANLYISVAVKETDNNVKITALNRISQMVKDDNLSSVVMDVLLVLPTPDLGVRQTALKLALKLVSSKTVDQVLRLLKKELSNSFSQDFDMADKYRFSIIDTIRDIASRFRDSAPNVVGLMLEFMAELDKESAVEVIDFCKETLESHPELNESIISDLIAAIHSIRSATAFHSALWVLGEYANSEQQVQESYKALMEGIGPLPFNKPVEQTEETVQTSTKPKVNADGTYATESPLEAQAAADAAKQLNEAHQLRKFITEGNSFLAGTLSATLAKLAIKFKNVSSNKKEAHRIQAQAMLVMSSLMRTEHVALNDDVFDRIYGCLNVLIENNQENQEKFLKSPLDAYKSLLSSEIEVRNAEHLASAEQSATRIESPINFRLFNNVHNPPKQAPKQSKVISTKNKSQLKQVTQLTGYSDSVYSEALMTVSQFDVVLDVMLFNQTEETLQNLKVEFFTNGELKLVESPSSVNIAPVSFHTCRAIIRVSSADAGHIFGQISYDTKQGNELILMNDIKLNIIDYIQPAKCADIEFRSMWAKFEWENKVPVKATKVPNLAKFLEIFMRETHMGCLTSGTEEDAKFLSANLYARSSFGESALVNLSVELNDGIVQGHARIRTEQRGPAVSIGDCINTLKY